LFGELFEAAGDGAADIFGLPGGDGADHLLHLPAELVRGHPHDGFHFFAALLLVPVALPLIPDLRANLEGDITRHTEADGIAELTNEGFAEALEKRERTHGIASKTGRERASWISLR
jgi:hypothetical protein